MNEDKFTHIYRLPGSLQIRIAKWQQTFRGTSDLVLHNALTVRNQQYQKPDFFPKGWCIPLVDEAEISITNHGKYIQTAMRTMVDRKVSYKRVFLSRFPLDQAQELLIQYKKEWIKKHNQVARKYNQIKKKEFMSFAWEELETLYPSIPKEKFDKALWNYQVLKEFGPEKKYSNPYFVKKADF